MPCPSRPSRLARAPSPAAWPQCSSGFAPRPARTSRAPSPARSTTRSPGSTARCAEPRPGDRGRPDPWPRDHRRVASAPPAAARLRFPGMARPLLRAAGMIRRYVVLGVVWAGCTVAWMLLGATLLVRSGETSSALVNEVHQLWGPPLDQGAPSGQYTEPRTRDERRTLYDAGGRP